MKTTDKFSAFLARRDDRALYARERLCNSLYSFHRFVGVEMDSSQQQIDDLCASDDDYECIADGRVCLELVDLLLDLLRE